MRTGQQEDRIGGTIHWLTIITIDVHVIHPAVTTPNFTNFFKKIGHQIFLFVLFKLRKKKRTKYSKKPKKEPKKINLRILLLHTDQIGNILLLPNISRY